MSSTLGYISSTSYLDFEQLVLVSVLGFNPQVGQVYSRYRSLQVSDETADHFGGEIGERKLDKRGLEDRVN